MTRIIRLAFELFARFRRDDIQAQAAHLTYYLILAFFPFLIFLTSIAGYANLSGEAMIERLSRLMPEDTARLVQAAAHESAGRRSGALLSLGMAGTLWASSNGFAAVIKGLNKAHGTAESRSFLHVRGLTLLATFVLTLVIVLTMMLLVFGRPFGIWLFASLGYPAGFELIWPLAVSTVPLAVMFGVLALLYRVLPNANAKAGWRSVAPGAAFATALWLGASMLFAIYVNRFDTYTAVYGSLGGIIVLLVWLYLSAVILLAGGELNALLLARKDCRSGSFSTFVFRWPWRPRAK